MKGQRFKKYADDSLGYNLPIKISLTPSDGANDPPCNQKSSNGGQDDRDDEDDFFNECQQDVLFVMINISSWKASEKKLESAGKFTIAIFLVQIHIFIETHLLTSILQA